MGWLIPSKKVKFICRLRIGVKVILGVHELNLSHGLARGAKGVKKSTKIFYK